MNEEVYKNGKRLRCGITTGTCAAAAAGYAAERLFLLAGNVGNSGVAVEQTNAVHPLSENVAVQSLSEPCISVRLPNGETRTVPVRDISVLRDDFGKISAVRCGVKKDAGDDPDVTDGMVIFATVSFCEADAGERHIRVEIDGGEGVGRVTKAGLDRPVGDAAINTVPRRMIAAAVQDAAERAGFDAETELAVRVVISAEGGAEIAKHTFNPRLGIEGGISILGTTGIVEPMSDRAIIETMRTEVRMFAAECGTAPERCASPDTHLVTKQEKGRLLCFVPGNYGEDYAKNVLRLSEKNTKIIRCSNFIGDAVDAAVEFGIENVLFVGHFGKLVKVASGIMNTHSREADGRLETLASCAILAGANEKEARAILECNTTEDALSVVAGKPYEDRLFAILVKRIEDALSRRAYGKIRVGAVLFSQGNGALSEDGISVFSENAKRLLKRVFIFAGTTEGRELAEMAVSQNIPCTVFVATEEGRAALSHLLPDIPVRVGRLNENEMLTIFAAERPAAVFDATHPYAIEVTKNLRKAAKQADVPYYRVLREEETVDYDGNETSRGAVISYADGTSEAAKLLADKYDNKRILLTTGSKEIATYTNTLSTETVAERLFARILPSGENTARVKDAGIPEEHILYGKGPFSAEENRCVLQKYQIDVLVTKESGKAGGFAEKLSAAKICGTDVIAVRRPKEENGISLSNAKKKLVLLFKSAASCYDR